MGGGKRLSSRFLRSRAPCAAYFRARRTPSRGVKFNVVRTLPARSCSVPSVLRERALDRASYHCEFRRADGTRCTQRTHLELDRVVLFCRGGEHSLKNVRVLCRAHNLYCAREELGDAFVQAMIQSKRGLAIPPPTGETVSHAPGMTPERTTSPDAVRISIS